MNTSLLTMLISERMLMNHWNYFPIFFGVPSGFNFFQKMLETKKEQFNLA